MALMPSRRPTTHDKFVLSDELITRPVIAGKRYA